MRKKGIQQMSKKTHMRKSGRPKKRIQRKKGTVIIKEFNKQTIYKNKEVIPYYNFFKV